MSPAERRLLVAVAKAVLVLLFAALRRSAPRDGEVRGHIAKISKEIKDVDVVQN